jgi:GR25 family glycosyltransferase involved in LPS biosynthesis
MQATLADLTRELKTYRWVSAQLLRDIKRPPNSVVYNVDFSVLFKYLWGAGPDSVPAFKPYDKVFENLARMHEFQPGFRLVFTGPSFWELLDSIHHKIQQLDTFVLSAASARAQIAKIADKEWQFNNLNQVLIKSSSAEKQLALLTEKGYAEHIAKPIERARNLLAKPAVLEGIGEFFEPPAVLLREYSRLFTDLLATMMQERSKAPGDERSEEDRRFHYSVDSANIIATSALNKVRGGEALLFLTTPGMKSKYCPDYGRNPLVPFYWISALRLMREGDIGSVEYFIGRMNQAATALIEVLRNKDSVRAVDAFTQGDIVEFYQRYVLPLNETEPNVGALQSRAEQEEQVREILEDPQKFRNRFQEGKERLVDEGRRLAELGTAFLDDCYCELSDVRASPVVSRIRRTLGLRRG